MSFSLEFKPRAEAEIADAFEWYDQPAVRQGEAFLAEPERVEQFIRLNPLLYPRSIRPSTGPTCAASASGISRSAIKGYETCRNMPGARELRWLCRTMASRTTKPALGGLC